MKKVVSSILVESKRRNFPTEEISKCFNQYGNVTWTSFLTLPSEVSTTLSIPREYLSYECQQELPFTEYILYPTHSKFFFSEENLLKIGN